MQNKNRSSNNTTEDEIEQISTFPMFFANKMRGLAILDILIQSQTV